jgi:hypothetical protein
MKQLNCPPCAGQDCQQGRACPVRTTRQRAGKPADYNDAIWIAKTNAELEEELEKQWRRDLKSIVFIASCILSFAIIVLVTAS